MNALLSQYMQTNLNMIEKYLKLTPVTKLKKLDNFELIKNTFKRLSEFKNFCDTPNQKQEKSKKKRMLTNQRFKGNRLTLASLTRLLRGMRLFPPVTYAQGLTTAVPGVFLDLGPSVPRTPAVAPHLTPGSCWVTMTQSSLSQGI